MNLNRMIGKQVSRAILKRISHKQRWYVQCAHWLVWLAIQVLLAKANPANVLESVISGLTKIRDCRLAIQNEQKNQFLKVVIKLESVRNVDQDSSVLDHLKVHN